MQRIDAAMSIESSMSADPGACSDKGLENGTLSPSQTMVEATGDLSTPQFSKRVRSIVTKLVTPMDTEDVVYQHNNPLRLEALRRRIDVEDSGSVVGESSPLVRCGECYPVEDGNQCMK